MAGRWCWRCGSALKGRRRPRLLSARSGRAFPDEVDWLERECARARAGVEQALELWKGASCTSSSELRQATGERSSAQGRRVREAVRRVPGRAPGAPARAPVAGSSCRRRPPPPAHSRISPSSASRPTPGPRRSRRSRRSGCRCGPAPRRAGSRSPRLTASAPPLRTALRRPAAARRVPPPRTYQRDARRRPARRPRTSQAREPELEERYLFAVCLSLPTERLHLCWQPSDEDGRPRSARRSSTRSASCSSAADGRADETLEALRSGGRSRRRRWPLPSPRTRRPLRRRLGARLPPRADQRGGRARRARRSRAVRGLDARGLPRLLLPLVRRPRAAARGRSTRAGRAVMGSAVHQALELTLQGPADARAAPTQATLEDWQRSRGASWSPRRRRGVGLGGRRHPSSVAARVRAEQQVLTFLARDARSETPLVPVAEMIEAGFGEREERPAAAGARRLGPARRDRPGRPAARGRRARWSSTTSSRARSPPRRSSRSRRSCSCSSTCSPSPSTGGPTPVGGLYHPLRGDLGAAPARGRRSSDERPTLAAYGLYDTRRRRGRGVRASCSRTRGERAGEIVARMRAGDIRRDPGPRHRPARPRRLPDLLPFAPICAAGARRPRTRRTRRRRSGERGTIADTRAAGGDRRPAAATSCSRPGPAPARPAVMVDRYCRLVCDEGVSPDAILAFTFTDKAAAELRQRIRGRAGARGPRRAPSARASC